MSQYTVTGRWKGRDGWQAFEKEIEAENENVAKERTYSEFGSKHGLKRPQIRIDGVEE